MAQTWTGLHFSSGGIYERFLQNDLAGLVHNYPVPSQALTTVKFYGSVSYNNLAVDSILLVDLDMNVQPTLYSKSIGGKKRLP
jgi:hypothetical protein